MLSDFTKQKIIELWFMCIIGTKEPTEEERVFFNSNLKEFKDHIQAQYQHALDEYEMFIKMKHL
ncbi:hypothetical protein RPMD05_9 [Rhodobacteraceae phage LS06-2018-MD05]|nr:hypothetical protein RPMD05_9 [Rhodobacteraceae phage LS06-2018-MD05]